MSLEGLGVVKKELAAIHLAPSPPRVSVSTERASSLSELPISVSLPLGVQPCKDLERTPR